MQAVGHTQESVANRKTRSKLDFLRVFKTLDHGHDRKEQLPGCRLEYDLRVHRAQEFLI